MSTVPSTPQRGRATLRIQPATTIPRPVVPPKPRNRFLAWLLPLPEPEALSPLLRCLAHKDRARFIEACADLAKMGMSAEDVEGISHAMQHRRILAFGSGCYTDIGEYANPYDGSTRGTPAVREQD